MTRWLVLIDLDHTLITSQFTLTDGSIVEKVQALQSRGIPVGLNSDRPYHTLRKYAHQLGLQGPLICERGNMIQLGSQTIFEESDLRPIMNQVRLAFIDLINQRHLDINLLVGESEKLFFQMKSFPVDQDVVHFVLMNKFRQFSIAFNSIHLIPPQLDLPEDTPWITHVALSDQLRELFLSATKQAPDVGVYRTNLACILHYPGTDKSQGTDRLLDTGFIERIFMIGDRPQDFLGRVPQILHGAVANAETAYKGNCQFVAPREFTGGVIDCLDWFLEHV